MNSNRTVDAAPLWSVQETAAFLGVPVATLYRWRHQGSGPKAYRVGRHLRYDPALVRQWLDTEAA
jgi:excisionase family DNA binding protein